MESHSLAIKVKQYEGLYYVPFCFVLMFFETLFTSLTFCPVKNRLHFETPAAKRVRSTDIFNKDRKEVCW